MKIIDILKKEKYLNEITEKEMNPNKIIEELENNFNNEFYFKSNKFIADKKEYDYSIHDSIFTISEKKVNNIFNVEITINAIAIYNESNQIGYLKNSKFLIKSKDSFRVLNNKYIMNYLIDEEKKEIAFLYLDPIKYKKIPIEMKYENISFKNGIEVLYEKKINKNLFIN